jgi:hypothetical protein
VSPPPVEAELTLAEEQRPHERQQYRLRRTDLADGAGASEGDAANDFLGSSERQERCRSW